MAVSEGIARFVMSGVLLADELPLIPPKAIGNAGIPPTGALVYANQ